MTATKIQSSHCGRIAFVYVRQSTPLQVIENRESTERQYRLRDRAIELGWPPTQVEVIDEDQGRSGSTAAHRTGFQRLATEVSLGKVGIVLMLEASRLARNNSDWYRLMEICGVSGTLIADEGGEYNPREPNDRLLLGVKGTISEAELFTLRTRLYEGRWNKARKGLLHFPLPVGYVQGADGSWTLDPDTQVRERLDYLFDCFRRHGVVRAVVRELKGQGLELPTRVTAPEGYGSLVWKAPTFICGRGYHDGDKKVCQSMTSRPVDAAVVAAFLGAVSPISLGVAMQVLDQVEQDLIAQRRQRELQLEQARYEARLAQRQYDAVDPANRIVAGGVERRW